MERHMLKGVWYSLNFPYTTLTRQFIVKQRASLASLKLAIWLIVLIPLLVVGLGMYYAVAQPGCASCHNRDEGFAQSTQKASHASVPCTACHVSPAPVDRFAFGFRQLFHMVLPVVGGDGKEWSAVPDDRCLACHKEINARVVSANGFRIAHQSCATGTACTDCHSAVAHGAATRWIRSYDMDACLSCHVTNGSTKCDTCHDEKDREARVTTSIFTVTHSKQWRTTHGMGNSQTCAVCHTATKCDKCHGPGLPHDKDFLAQHSTISRDPRAKCTMCHETRFCLDCHGLQMPHSRAFTRAHAVTAKADPKLCKRCHADPDCTECHLKHVHPGGAIDSLRKLSPPKVGR